jgi:hypothetical protein
MNSVFDSDDNRLAYVLKKLDDYIGSFHGSVAWYRRVYFFTSLATLIFSGLITIIVGWKPEFQIGVRTENLVLVLGALITIVSGWGFFFSPKESWLIYASSLNRLRALKTKIEFLNTSPDAFKSNEKLASEGYAEFQAVFDAHNKAWLELRAAPNSTLRRNEPKEARS